MRLGAAAVFLTLQLMKVVALSTDGDEGENSAGKTKKKRKKKKGCKTFRGKPERNILHSPTVFLN